MDAVTLHHGDALDVLRGMADNSVDAVVTDPPYGLSDHDADDVAEALGCWLRGEEYHHGRGGFMGRSWDEWVPGPSLWREVYRVLKPGGHLLCFAGTRTQDLMGIAIRLAGFECRDTLQWLYGSGFPKSHDVGKAIDKAAGAEREVVGKSARHVSGKPNQRTVGLNGSSTFAETVGMGMYATAPATDAARQWDGWGTALKPAHEPILVFRKPLAGTVAANVLAYGTGGLNIGASRVAGVGVARTRNTEGGGQWASSTQREAGYRPRYERENTYQQYETPPAGRWPANLVLSHAPGCERVGTRRVKADKGGEAPAAATWGTYGTTPGRHYADADGLEAVEEWACVDGCAVKALAEQSGERKAAGHYNGEVTAARHGFIGGNTDAGWGYGDTGTAARFFPNFEASPLDDVTPFLYTAKASRREREAGLEGMEERPAGALKPGDGGWRNEEARGRQPRHDVQHTARNHHPTVKPLALMRWLVRLVTPPGGVVLDPFTGSGTTGMAAVMEGFAFIGIEQDAEYIEIAWRRIAWAQEQQPPLLRATGD